LGDAASDKSKVDEDFGYSLTLVLTL